MFSKKNEKSVNDFWREYEEKTGEKVLKRGLGKYVSGWNEFDKEKLGGTWGLVITTSGGFRFHHFPQYNWIDSFTRFSEKEPPKEKTIFIPNDKIISTEYIIETKWWKKIFGSLPPQLFIRYMDESETLEKTLIFEAEYKEVI
ncbi:MAG: hypothetical protein LBC80_08610 [Treponema sp.]|jgi:hypothetical protein|nr:hypothetical protein [Treponema sp.]